MKKENVEIYEQSTVKVFPDGMTKEYLIQNKEAGGKEIERRGSQTCSEKRGNK